LSLFFPSWQLVSDLISAHELFHLVFSPYPAEEEEQGSSLVGTWQPVKVNPPQAHSCLVICPAQSEGKEA